MRRRKFLQVVGASALSSALPRVQMALAADDQSAQGGNGKSNIILIVLDDQNDWLGHLGGHPQALSPSIDAFAAESVAFTNAYCAVPICNPSRTALLTGMTPQRSGVFYLDQDWRPLGLTTIVHAARMKGYKTIRIGKAFHSPFEVEDLWDFAHSARPSPQPDGVPVLGVAPSLDGGGLDARDSDMQDYRNARRAAELIREYSSQPDPFLMIVGLKSPHLPWYLPKKYFSSFPTEAVLLPSLLPGDLDDMPSWSKRIARAPWDDPFDRQVGDLGVRHDLVRAFLASVLFTDRCCQLIFDEIGALRAAGDVDTIVCLTSDHGQSLGEKEHWKKGLLNEDNLRVPLLLSAPRHIPQAVVHDKPVSLLDVLPTLARMADLQFPHELDGHDLAPIVAGSVVRPPVVSYLTERIASVRDYRYRYTLCQGVGGDELYDLRVDPHEWTNLANNKRYADVVKRLNWFLVKKKHVNGDASMRCDATPSNDVTPDAIEFEDAVVSDQRAVYSNAVRIEGIGRAVVAELEGHSSGRMSINGGALTAGPITINPLDVVRLRMVSSGREETRSLTFRVGGGAAVWHVRTLPGLSSE